MIEVLEEFIAQCFYGNLALFIMIMIALCAFIAGVVIVSVYISIRNYNERLQEKKEEDSKKDYKTFQNSYYYDDRFN